MHSATLLVTVGFTMGVITSAAPLTDPTPTMHPLFQVVSRIPVSTATGVANATTGKPSNHKHTPDCEHKSNANHTATTDDAHKSSTEVTGHDGERQSHEATSTENLSPYPGVNASAYAHPHAVQAHNHTGYNCNHTSQRKPTTASDGAYAQISTPGMLNTSADSSDTHPGHRCAHPSQLSRTTAGRSYDKKSVVPEVEVEERVCLAGDCKDSTVVTANLDGAGELTGIEAKNSKRIASRDTDFTYEDIARQMSGARVAGGM